MKYIAIDIGSSYVKAVVLDVDSDSVVASDKRPTPEKLAHANPRYFENDAGVFIQLVQELCERFVAAYVDVEGILLSTQMHGFVYTIPGMDDIYVSWQDLRCLDSGPSGQSYLHQLEAIVPPGEMNRAGVYLKPSLGLCNLYALLNIQPKLPRTGTLHTLGSYIIGKLTGKNICHISNAAPLGMVDIVAGGWNHSLLAKLGLGEVTLPELALRDFQPCGSYKVHGREIFVYPDWGDQQIAVLGCLAGGDDAIINIATGAQVLVPTDDLAFGAYEIRPYFEGGHIRTISNMPAGRGLDVFIRFLREATQKVHGQGCSSSDIWKAIDDGFVFDPNGIAVDMGIYPVSEKLNGGSVSGIRPDNLSLSSLFSAAYLDMAKTYWENIQILRAPEKINRIVCAGGVSWKSPHLLEAITTVSGKKCALSPMADEVVSGMFQAALICSGKKRTLAESVGVRLHM